MGCENSKKIQKEYQGELFYDENTEQLSPASVENDLDGCDNVDDSRVIENSKKIQKIYWGQNVYQETFEQLIPTTIENELVNYDDNAIESNFENKNSYLQFLQNKCLQQYSIAKQKVIHDYGEQISINTYFSKLCTSATANNKYQFVIDDKGFVSQWDIRDQKLLKEYTNHELNVQSPYTKISTSDSRFLFLSSFGGKLVQLNIEERKVEKDYGKIHSNTIRSMAVTYDNIYQFTSDASGNVKQWEIAKQTLIQDYGQVHSSIHSIVVSIDSQYLFTSDNSGYLKQWDISKQTEERQGTLNQLELKLLKNYGQVHQKGLIRALFVTNDNRHQFFSGFRGYLIQWDLQKKKIIKNYGEVHDAMVSAIMSTRDGKYLLTNDDNGSLKMWDIKLQKLVRKFSKIDDVGIGSIATVSFN